MYHLRSATPRHYSGAKCRFNALLASLTVLASLGLCSVASAQSEFAIWGEWIVNNDPDDLGNEPVECRMLLDQRFRVEPARPEVPISLEAECRDNVLVKGIINGTATLQNDGSVKLKLTLQSRKWECWFSCGWETYGPHNLEHTLKEHEDTFRENMWVSHVSFGLNAELIFGEKCVTCHNPELAPSSGARLTDMEGLPGDASSATLRAFRESAPDEALPQ